MPLPWKTKNRGNLTLSLRTSSSSAGLHRPARRPGAQAESKPDALRRRVRAQQLAPRMGDALRAGQGPETRARSRRRRTHPHRTAGSHDLGTTLEACVQDRHRDLPGLRRGGQNHCLHRGPGGDREDPRPPRLERRPSATRPSGRKNGRRRRFTDAANIPSCNAPCGYLSGGRASAGRMGGSAREPDESRAEFHVTAPSAARIR